MACLAGPDPQESTMRPCRCCLLLAALLAVPLASHTASAAPSVADTAASAAVDPEAIGALTGMGKALRALPQSSMAATTRSVVYSLPVDCTTIVVDGIGYQQCSNGWYQPRYVGTTVQYIVVDAPR